MPGSAQTAGSAPCSTSTTPWPTTAVSPRRRSFPPHRAPGTRGGVPRMGELKFGPARVPSQESPEAAVEILLERGYTACEIDFEGRFWMDYDFAARLGELARDHEIVLSVHAPIAGFTANADLGKKLNTAVGITEHRARV